MTAATAPATAPRTVVAAEASVDGFFGAVFRLVGDAAARPAVFRFALFVFGAGRFRGTRDFCVERFRTARFATDFPPRDRPPAERFAEFRARDGLLPDLRLATFPPVSRPSTLLRTTLRWSKSRSSVSERKKGAAVTPLVTGHSGIEMCYRRTSLV